MKLSKVKDTLVLAVTVCALLTFSVKAANSAEVTIPKPEKTIMETGQTGTARTAEGRAKEGTPITIKVGNTVIRATLDNSRTSWDFLASLPVTMKMTRWGNREYYGKVKTPLSDEGRKQNRFENGDVAYWAPGGSFAIFFNDKENPDISNLIVMGKITSDLNVFKSLGESVEMRIEIAK